MKFSAAWLREWVNPEVTNQTLAEQLTMAGLEVECIEPVASEFTNIVIGKVLTTEKHPDADKLSICTVDVKGPEILQIVCGAKNVEPNIIVPVALVGAILNKDFKIKKSTLRGVESHGMICSASELGLAERANGIMHLPNDAPLGESIRDYLDLDDVSLEVDLTPNRGDCLSLLGLAREVGVLNKINISRPVINPVMPTQQETFPIKITAESGCSQYCGRIIKNINPKAITPLWLQEKLRRSGLRSVHPVVDITNYVMLELGQPMHAFDLNKLNNQINIRLAKPGEKLILLDESEVNLSDNTLLITDQSGPLAIAGIMGGLASSVTTETQDIFLESATFTPKIIAGRARSYGLSTDSSHRFERGVDPKLAEQAIARATELLLTIVGGEPGPVTRKVTQTPETKIIHLKSQKILKLLGLAMAPEEILTRLGFGLEQTSDGWTVTVPSYRYDVSIEADLIEELARIHGYNHLPTTTHNSHLLPTLETETNLNRIKQLLCDRGMSEAITYSFVNQSWQAKLFPHTKAIGLANPLSQEQSHMRVSLWPGLLSAVQYNQHRQQMNLALFEAGLCFIGDKQIQHLAGLRTGKLNADHWCAEARGLDFYDIKADIEAIFNATAVPISFQAAEHPALHPGQSAQLIRHENPVGWVGMLHPSLYDVLGLSGPVGLFELDWSAVNTGVLPKFESISKYPANRRDISFYMNESVTSGEIIDTILSSASELIQNAFIFDLYQGGNVPVGKKSLAVGLIIQDNLRTLVDQEINHCLESTIERLKQTYAIELRD